MAKIQQPKPVVQPPKPAAPLTPPAVTPYRHPR